MLWKKKVIALDLDVRNSAGYFEKRRTWWSRKLIRWCNFWPFPPIKFALRGTKHNNWHSRFRLKAFENSESTLAGWNAATVSWDWQFFFRKKQTLCTFWLYQSIKFAMLGDFPGTSSLTDALQIEKSWETLIEGIQKVIFWRIGCFYKDDPFNYSFEDNFRVPGFRSEKANTTLDSRVAFCKKKNIEWVKGLKTGSQ